MRRPILLASFLLPILTACEVTDATPPAIAIIGHTPGMIEVFKRVGQAAGNRATVLIRGESGTGKELVAR